MNTLNKMEIGELIEYLESSGISVIIEDGRITDVEAK